MKRKMIIEPADWPCSLDACPPGFFMYRDCLCFKTEYGPGLQVFNEAGEVFWGGVDTKEQRANLAVTPCGAKWVDDD